MMYTKWAVIVVFSELDDDDNYEVRLDNPAGGPYIAVQQFAKDDNPQPWINREMGKYLRQFRKDYHKPRPPAGLMHPEPAVDHWIGYDYDDEWSYGN